MELRLGHTRNQNVFKICILRIKIIGRSDDEITPQKQDGSFRSCFLQSGLHY